jgi:hypothetical protein
VDLENFANAGKTVRRREREREREREMKDRNFADAAQMSTPICSRVGLELLFVALIILFRFWIMLSTPIVV